MLKLLGLSDELRLPLARHPFFIYLFFISFIVDGLRWLGILHIGFAYSIISIRQGYIVWFDVLFAELLLNVLYFLQTMQLLMAI